MREIGGIPSHIPPVLLLPPMSIMSPCSIMHLLFSFLSKVGLNVLVQKANKFTPATRLLVQRFVPFPAVGKICTPMCVPVCVPACMRTYHMVGVWGTSKHLGEWWPFHTISP